MVETSRLWNGWLWLINRNFGYILGIIAALSLWTYVGESLFDALPNELSFLASLYSLFGSLVLSATLIVRTLGPKSADLTLAFSIVLSRFWSVLGLSIVIYFGTLLGFILFFLPGLVVMTFLMPAMCILLSENQSVFGAISESVRLMRPAFWPVFGMTIALGILLFVLLILTKWIGPIATGQMHDGHVILSMIVENTFSVLSIVWSVAVYFEIRHLALED